MKSVIRVFFLLILPLILFNNSALTEESDEETTLYSLLFTSNTAGRHDLLAKKIAAIGEFNADKGLTISFGSLLGSERIVTNDKGVAFLRAARRGGLDCLIPGVNEFAFGFDTFRMLSAYNGLPRFVSANIVNERTRESIVDPYVTFTVSNLRICVVGMSDLSIIKDSQDMNVVGIDIISFEDAFQAVSDDIAEDRPDIVIVAGRLDRAAVVSLARKFPVIDAFATNNQAGGFGNTSSIAISDKPVYIASEKGETVSRFSVTYRDGMETREFVDIELGKDAPADEATVAALSTIIEDLERQDAEEAVILKAGKEVTSLLSDVFDVDTVIIDRGSLYYYPIEDSLQVVNVRHVIKPGQKLVSFSLTGSLLKSVLNQSGSETDALRRLSVSGIDSVGKIDDIPIQDDRRYTVLSTPLLFSGGHGYRQLTEGGNERFFDNDMLEMAESYLVAKEERIALSMKKKPWALNLHLKIGANLNKRDVDDDKAAYGKRVPKPFRDYQDQFTGLLSITSNNNTFSYRKNNQQYDSRLDMRYVRSGYKPEVGHVIYKEAGDNIKFYNKYTYNHDAFILKPYIDNTVTSEFYSSKGKHPIYGSVSSGVTRKFPSLFNLVVNVGVSADRNYLNNVNGMGGRCQLNIDKAYAANKVLTKATSFSSVIVVDYKPMARYDMEFSLRNQNDFTVQIWKRVNLAFHVNSYAYRNTTLRKVAVGFYYDFTLNYGMDWKF